MNRLGELKCLYEEELAQVVTLTPARQVTPLSEPTVSHVKSSQSFVRKFRKSWLAHGSSGMLGTLLPKTSSL